MVWCEGVARVELPQLGESHVADTTAAVGGAVDFRVVDDHQLARAALVHIELDDPGTGLQARAKALQGVLGAYPGSPSVGEAHRPVPGRRRSHRTHLRARPPECERGPDADQQTEGERHRTKPELPDVVGDDGAFALLLDDRVAHNVHSIGSLVHPLDTGRRTGAVP